MRKQLRPYQQDALDSIGHLLYSPFPPTVIEASVGSGKSLMIATFLMQAVDYGRRCLCLTHSCDLIDQNYKTLVNQGGSASLYCAALNSKSMDGDIVFASPQSLCRNLGEEIFDIIVIDECHLVNMHAKDGMFRRIINHYFNNARLANKYCNVVGLTGTPHRGRTEIVGDSPDYFFKSTAFKITTNELVDQGFLVRPQFEIAPSGQEIPFQSLKVRKTGRFDDAQLAAITASADTKTKKIMHILGQRMASEGRGGAFVFCATILQCSIAKEALDNYGEARIITANTPTKDRMEWLEQARKGGLRYLLSVNCLLVGVDIPLFDVCCFIRPTESLTLFVQALGRALRLSPGKISALIMDYAGNIERHQDIDDPLLNEAIQPKEGDQDYCLECFDCGTLNKLTARRCIGLSSGKRCSHYFEFKPCPSCQVENDITARHCRACSFEILDHNRKLQLPDNTKLLQVDRVKYQITTTNFTVYYLRKDGDQLYVQATESFNLTSKKALNVFYGAYIRKQVPTPSKWYMYLHQPEKLREMVSAGIVEPANILVELPSMKIKKKIFSAECSINIT